MSAADGLPLAEAVRDAADAISDGSWAGLGGAAISAAGRVGELVADPIGAILGGGFGFVLEHVPMLGAALDLVSGDEEAIDAVVTGWLGSVAGPLEASAGEATAAVERLMTGWEGTAAESFADRSAALTRRRDCLAVAARAGAAGVRMAGTLVLSVRELIRDELARFLGWLAAGYVIAAAASIPSGGASVASWMNTAVLRGAQLAQRFGRAIARLLDKLTELTARIGRLADAVDAMHRGAAEVARSAAVVSRAARRGEGIGALGADLSARWARAAPSLKDVGLDAAAALGGGGVKAVGDGWKSFSAAPPEPSGAEGPGGELAG